MAFTKRLTSFKRWLDPCLNGLNILTISVGEYSLEFFGGGTCYNSVGSWQFTFCPFDGDGLKHFFFVTDLVLTLTDDEES